MPWVVADVVGSVTSGDVNSLSVYSKAAEFLYGYWN